MGLYNVKVRGNQLILENFYAEDGNRPQYPDYGLYTELPDGMVPNKYAGDSSFSGNWMNWAYNNPYQPHTDMDKRRPIKMGYIDGSGANATKVLGSMKEIWKEFEEVAKRHGIDLTTMTVKELEETWWFYYIMEYAKNFEDAVKKFQGYIKEKRALFTKEERAEEFAMSPYFNNDIIWVEGCRSYLKYLVRTSARGFMMESLLLKALERELGGEYVESDIKSERKGIDGYMLIDGAKYPICLKPSTFSGGVSPVYDGCFVVYNKSPYKRNDDLVFTFKTGGEILGKGNRDPQYLF